MNLDIGLMTFDLQAVPAYARGAEEMGLGAIWSAETRHDPFLPLALASTSTSRVGRSGADFTLVSRISSRAGTRSRSRATGRAWPISSATRPWTSGSLATIGERIRERYRGLYDRTQLYPSFQPSLDDPRWPAALAGFQGPGGPMLQFDRERRSVWRS